VDGECCGWGFEHGGRLLRTQVTRLRFQNPVLHLGSITNHFIALPATYPPASGFWLLACDSYPCGVP
jgi:hypothetical protein